MVDCWCIDDLGGRNGNNGVRWIGDGRIWSSKNYFRFKRRKGILNNKKENGELGEKLRKRFWSRNWNFEKKDWRNVKREDRCRNNYGKRLMEKNVYCYGRYRYDFDSDILKDL